MSEISTRLNGIGLTPSADAVARSVELGVGVNCRPELPHTLQRRPPRRAEPFGRELVLAPADERPVMVNRSIELFNRMESRHWPLVHSSRHELWAERLGRFRGRDGPAGDATRPTVGPDLYPAEFAARGPSHTYS